MVGSERKDSEVLSLRLVLRERWTWIAAGTLIGVIGLAYFSRFWRFGLYEDDYSYIGWPSNWTWNELLQHLVKVWATWPQGRPLGWSLPQTISFLGFHAGGGLPFLYLLAFAIVALNAILFYLLVRRLAGVPFALFGALAFTLFPADTTHMFLMHAFGLQTGLTLVLLALHAYVGKKRLLSYLLAVGALLTYESTFLPFLAAPLLILPWNRVWVRGGIRHLGISFGILILDFLIRQRMGEMRISTNLSDPLDVMSKAAISLILGPAVSLQSYVYRLATTWLSKSQAVYLVIGVVFVLLCVVFYLLGKQRQAPLSLSLGHLPGVAIKVSSYLAEIVGQISPQFLLAGVVMLCASYLLSFTHFPPLTLAGRLTSVHLAAAIGAGLVIGWICAALWYLAMARRGRWLAIAALAFFFASFAGFGVMIQMSYQSAWQQERTFYANLLKLIPDLQDGTIVLVEGYKFRNSFISSNPGGYAAGLLRQTMIFPSEWKQEPRIYLVDSTWKERVTFDSVEWHLDTTQSSGLDMDYMNPTLDPQKLIILQAKDNELVRLQGPLHVHGGVLNLVMPGQTQSFPKRPLYNVLFAQ